MVASLPVRSRGSAASEDMNSAVWARPFEGAGAAAVLDGDGEVLNVGGSDDVGREGAELHEGENAVEGHVTLRVGLAFKLGEAGGFLGKFALVADLQIQFAVNGVDVRQVEDAEPDVDTAIGLGWQRDDGYRCDRLAQRGNGEGHEGEGQVGLRRRGECCLGFL